MDNPTLSVVFATLNRKHYLRKCLDSIYSSARGLSVEVVVVDGGSTDGSLDLLRAEQSEGKIRLLEQGRVLGAVRAFNAGFALANGEYVANFNDDAEYVGDTLVQACKMLDERADVGQVAIPYGHPGETPECSMKTVAGRAVLYANFGVTRKWLGDAVGWWGDYLFRYAGDNELSMQVFAAGYLVAPLPSNLGSVIHYQADDATRVNSPNDTTLFDAKWSSFHWDKLGL